MTDRAFERWLAGIEARYLEELTFPEVSRALRALSSLYVERRHLLERGAAFTGAGKRAAYMLFYGPLHYLIVREIARRLPAPAGRTSLLVDLGCGTGAAGAAWGTRQTAPPTVLGVDRHPWALQEARCTYRAFGLASRVRRQDLGARSIPGEPASIVAAFTLNELPASARDALLRRAVDFVARPGRDGSRAGRQLLVVEPLAGSAAPWWERWRTAVVAAGGRADEWRFRADLPPVVAKLDRAAGIHHDELTARSLWLG